MPHVQLPSLTVPTFSLLHGAASQAAFFKEERDVMAMSQSPWITTLHFAFQSNEYLFLVMEFIAVRMITKYA